MNDQTPAPSVLHIWYRLRNGKVSGLQVGGGAPDDALRCISEALNEDAVSITITREDAWKAALQAQADEELGDDQP